MIKSLIAGTFQMEISFCSVLIINKKFTFCIAYIKRQLMNATALTHRFLLCRRRKLDCQSKKRSNLSSLIFVGRKVKYSDNQGGAQKHANLYFARCGLSHLFRTSFLFMKLSFFALVLLLHDFYLIFIILFRRIVMITYFFTN